MKSEIYSNYNLKNKWHGIIEYKSLAIFFCMLFVIFSISSLFNLSFKIVIILLCIILPIGAILLFCNTKNESSVDIIYNVMKFYFRNKIYLSNYRKESTWKFNRVYIVKN